MLNEKLNPIIKRPRAVLATSPLNVYWVLFGTLWTSFEEITFFRREYKKKHGEYPRIVASLFCDKPLLLKTFSLRYFKNN